MKPALGVTEPAATALASALSLLSGGDEEAAEAAEEAAEKSAEDLKAETEPAAQSMQEATRRRAGRQ